MTTERAVAQPAGDESQKIRAAFDALLAKTNKEHPAPADVQALSNLGTGSFSLLYIQLD